MGGQNISAETHPNVFAWFFLVSKFSEAIMKQWPAGGAAAGGKAKGGKGGDKKGAKKEAKKEEDELDDLFGEEDEDEAQAARFAAVAAKEAAKGKKAKKTVIAMSLVMLEVKPMDDTIDLDKLAAKCFAEITQDGLFWKTEFKKEPVAFG